jgi:DNA modification methylase
VSAAPDPPVTDLPGLTAEQIAAATRVVDIDTIRPHPDNPNRGSIPTVRESLRAHGQYRTIVVQQATGHVLAGNTTWAAAKAEGRPTIAVIELDVDDEEAVRIMLADNRSAQLGDGYDDQILADILAGLPDLEGTGWNPADLDALEADIRAAEPLPPLPADPDDVPPLPADPVTRAGDVWHLGVHRLLCGDATSRDDVTRLLDGATVNVAFTSPPYATQRTYDASSGFVPISPDDYVDWFAAVQANVRAHLANDGSWFVNIKGHTDDGQRHLYVHDLVTAHVRSWGWRFVDELIWRDTRNGMPGKWPNRFKDAWEPVFHYCHQPQIKFRPHANGAPTDDAWTYSTPTRIAMSTDGYSKRDDREEHPGLALPSNVIEIPAGGTGGHPAAFPVALPAWFLRAYTDPGDTAFDPFAGSGSALIAAHLEDRIGYGVEISPAYCDVICRRFQTLTGTVPQRVEDSRPVEHDFR